MVVLLAIIAVLAGAQRLLSRPVGDPVRPVEYASAAESARSVAPFDVLAPEQLPKGWRATSVRYVPGDEATWHLGILTDADKYIGVEQAVGDMEGLIDTYAAESEADGVLEVDGESWQLLRDGDETTLVRDDGGSATLVTGDAPQSDVELLVASLRNGQG
jgi:hypothetical protein